MKARSTSSSWLRRLTCTRFLRTSLIGMAILGSTFDELKGVTYEITLPPFVVYARSDGWTMTIENYWQGDHWEMDISIDVGQAPSGDLPTGQSSNSIIYESVPVRVADQMIFYRTYSDGSNVWDFNLILAGDGHIYSWMADLSVYKIENSDGSWSIVSYPPPPYFPEGT